MNNQIFYFFYNLAHRSVGLDKLFVFVAEVFPYIVVALALIFLLKRRASFKKIILIFFPAGLAWLLSKGLKILIHTNRPFLELSGVRSLFPETGFAFPSGHAAFFGALSFSLFFYRKGTGTLFIFFAFLIGIARIAAGVHFPVDILGGFVLGALIAYLLKNV